MCDCLLSLSKALQVNLLEGIPHLIESYIRYPLCHLPFFLLALTFMTIYVQNPQTKPYSSLKLKSYALKLRPCDRCQKGRAHRIIRFLYQIKIQLLQRLQKDILGQSYLLIYLHGRRVLLPEP